MKKLFTLLALTISFVANSQITTNSTDNSGEDASAIGLQTTANGIISTAMGAGTIASGGVSTAMGYYKRFYCF